MKFIWKLSLRLKIFDPSQSKTSTIVSYFLNFVFCWGNHFHLYSYISLSIYIGNISLKLFSFSIRLSAWLGIWGALPPCFLVWGTCSLCRMVFWITNSFVPLRIWCASLVSESGDVSCSWDNRENHNCLWQVLAMVQPFYFLLIWCCPIVLCLSVVCLAA